MILESKMDVVNMNVFPPESNSINFGQAGLAQRGSGQVGNVALPHPYRQRNIEDWPVCGKDCFQGDCYEAQLGCGNRPLPGTAFYDPCIGGYVNKYNYFPYKYVVGTGRRRHRRH